MRLVGEYGIQVVRQEHLFPLIAFDPESLQICPLNEIACLERPDSHFRYFSTLSVS